MYEIPLRWVGCKTREPGPEDPPEEQIAHGLGLQNHEFWVCIHDYAVPDAAATERDGRPRFRNVPYIAVKVKGERDYNSAPLKDEDKRRYPHAWRTYQYFKEQTPTTNVALLPGITPADLRELGALKLESVEALAAYAGELGTLDPFRVLAKRLLTLNKPRFRLVDGAPVPVENVA